MAARRRRDPWQSLWGVAVADMTLAALVFGLAAALAMAAILPQAPQAEPVSRAQTLSSVRGRFGGLARAMDVLGLMDIVRSWGFGTLVGLTTCCIVLRVVDQASCLLTTHDSSTEPGAVAAPARSWLCSPKGGMVVALVAHAGAVLVVAGISATRVWGWEASTVAFQGRGVTMLPGRTAWAVYDEDDRVTVSAALQVREVDRGPGVKVTAISSDGSSLPLQRGRNAAAEAELEVALTADPDLGTREALFTIQGSDLIIRIAPLHPHAPELDVTDRFLVQAYRSPSGELAAEESVRGEAAVQVRDVSLTVDSLPYARVTAGYSPGRWPSIAGLILLLIAIGASTVRGSGLGCGRGHAPQKRPLGDAAPGAEAA